MTTDDSYRRFRVIAGDVKKELNSPDSSQKPRVSRLQQVALTRDRVDDAVVKKVNEQLLSDLPVGDTTDFYQLGDLLILTRRSVQPNRT